MANNLFAMLQAYGTQQKGLRLEVERENLYKTAVQAYATKTRYPELFKKELKEFINSLSDEIIDEGVNLYEGTPAGTAIHKVLNGVGFNLCLEDSNEVSKRRYTLKVLIINLERRLKFFIEKVIHYDGELTNAATNEILSGIDKSGEKEFIVCEYDEFLKIAEDKQNELFSLDGRELLSPNIALGLCCDGKVYLFITDFKPRAYTFKARKE